MSRLVRVAVPVRFVGCLVARPFSVAVGGHAFPVDLDRFALARPRGTLLFTFPRAVREPSKALFVSTASLASTMTGPKPARDAGALPRLRSRPFMN